MVATPRNRRHDDFPGSSAGAGRVVSADGRAIPAASLEQLERLDDTFFAALNGDPLALDDAAKAWRQAGLEVDARLLDETRRHYVRRARSRWRRAMERPERRLAAGFAALEVLGLLGEEPVAA